MVHTNGYVLNNIEQHVKQIYNFKFHHASAAYMELRQVFWIASELIE